MLSRKHETSVGRRTLSSLALVAIGMTAGLAMSAVRAQMAPPSVHKGLTVTGLGVIPEDSMLQQIGLGGYKLQLRAITIAPGGQIARHSHDKRPGLVKVIDGTWTEGRPTGRDGRQGLTHATEITWPERPGLGERDFTAADTAAIIEDRETVHWFYNRTDKPATALVCDIVPSK